MSERIYNTDLLTDIQELRRKKFRPWRAEVLPRQTVYGSSQAIAIGLEPLEATPDALIQPDEYDERLAEAHEAQALPIYHMHNTWRPAGTKYNQDGLSYCWTWSGTGCVMTTRALEDKDTVLLAPASMGYLVGWRDRGNYLESFIQGAREQGICPAVDGNINDLTRSAAHWDEVGQREKYRLATVWDCRSDAMTQHCISILYYGRSLYIAYDWWAHALELVGIRMVDGKLYWDISNSHNEPDVITLTGSRAVPSEAYGFVSTVLAE